MKYQDKGSIFIYVLLTIGAKFVRVVSICPEFIKVIAEAPVTTTATRIELAVKLGDAELLVTP